MKVVVINSGSSSVKYELFESSDFSVLSSGLLEQIGESESRHTHRIYGASGSVKETVRRGRVANHEEGFRFILSMPADSSSTCPLSFPVGLPPHSPQCCQGLEGLGITVDDRKSEKACEEVLEIQRDGAPVNVLAMRTKEEREIAEQTIHAIEKAKGLKRKV